MDVIVLVLIVTFNSGVSEKEYVEPVVSPGSYHTMDACIEAGKKAKEHSGLVKGYLCVYNRQVLEM
jgi:hypothetical protein